MITNFLFTYWKEIAYGVVAVATLLVALFRKKGKVDPVLDKLLEITPTVIRDIESAYGPGNGPLKKQMVMKSLAKVYKGLCGYELKEGCGIWNYLSNYVEKVLLTPERKV